MVVRLYCRRPRTRAIAAVELAVVLPLVCLLLFAIIEFGLLFKDALVLQQAVREACRAAAVGATPAKIERVLRNRAVTLNANSVEIDLDYRVRQGGQWSEWTTLDYSDDGEENDAPPGAQIRVRAHYNHPLVTGGLVAALFSSSDSTGVPLSAVAVVRRE